MAYCEPGHKRNRRWEGGKEVKKKGEERGREKTTECKRVRKRERERERRGSEMFREDRGSE